MSLEEVQNSIASATEEPVVEPVTETVTQIVSEPVDELVTEAEAPEASSDASSETSVSSDSSSEASATTEDTASTSSDSQTTDSMPAEMAEWIDSIDKIEYHFRSDDYDENRSFNFFKDAAGNTLKIVEFYIGEKPYLHINDSHIISRDDFLQVANVEFEKGDNKSNISLYSKYLSLDNVPTSLIAEALMIIGDSDSENESDCESDTCSESSCEDEEKVIPEPAPEPQPKPTDSQRSVVNFLSTFFVAILFLKIFGTFCVLAASRK